VEHEETITTIMHMREMMVGQIEMPIMNVYAEKIDAFIVRRKDIL